MIASPIIGVAARRVALGQNIRIGIIVPYIIIYHNDDDSDTVTVLRIVHGRRRITGQLLGSA
jgi:toxin ParE1/3/4